MTDATTTHDDPQDSAVGTATYSPDDNKLRLYPLSRLDEDTYRNVRDAGFRWAPKQELFVAPSWSPEREDLLRTLCGDIDDEDTSLVERAEERADRFDTYRHKRARDGEAAHAAVSQLADAIPLGQPILVGHHSEKRARRDAQRIEDGMRRAVKAFETSQYWAARAAGAIRAAKYKEQPTVRARRIKRLEAERRRRVREYTPAEPRKEVVQQGWDGSAAEPYVWCGAGRGGSWVRVAALAAIEARQSRWIAHLDLRLVYERAMLEAEGKTALLDKPKRPAKPPLLNFRCDELKARNRYRNEVTTYKQVEMTKEQWTRIPADSKATRLSLDESYRFRFTLGRCAGRKSHDDVAVFLTDSKAHSAPESRQAQASVPMPPVAAPRPLPQYAAPQRTEEGDKARQLRQALATGVRAVAVPSLFETPEPLVRQLIDEADIQPGHTVLEPSAGTGVLARAAFERSGAAVVCVETNQDLYDRLRRLDFVHPSHTRCDFLDYHHRTFDRIVMNPPFERGQDRQHVQHAYELLNPGGRLVAVMSEGPFFRQADAAFRHWLKEQGGTSVKLPEDSFAVAGTSVRTRLVTIDRPL